VCVCVCVCARARACVCACVHARVRACVVEGVVSSHVHGLGKSNSQTKLSLTNKRDGS
jgi:hypothetical protein